MGTHAHHATGWPTHILCLWGNAEVTSAYAYGFFQNFSADLRAVQMGEKRKGAPKESWLHLGAWQDCPGYIFLIAAGLTKIGGKSTLQTMEIVIDTLPSSAPIRLG